MLFVCVFFLQRKNNKNQVLTYYLLFTYENNGFMKKTKNVVAMRLLAQVLELFIVFFFSRVFHRVKLFYVNAKMYCRG